MQPTVNNIDSLRTSQVPDYSKVFGTVSKTTQPTTNCAGKVDKTPAQDTVEISDKPKMSKTKKILLAMGATIATALGAVYGVRKYQVKNIKNIQKSFQEIFMRDDITVEQTREMMKRYKEIEKITDREEYAKALFEEVKKNFGMGKSNIRLVFEDQKNAAGFCSRDNSVISITPRCSREHMLNTMHHEFRHAKQHNAIYNLYPEEHAGARVIMDSYLEQMVDKNIKLSPEELKELWTKALKEYREKGIDLTDPKTKDLFDFCKKQIQGNFVIESVPEKYKAWAEKCRDGVRNYKSHNEDLKSYWENFTEIDARKAGITAEKYIKGKAFNFKTWLNNKVFEDMAKNAG